MKIGTVDTTPSWDYYKCDGRATQTMLLLNLKNGYACVYQQSDTGHRDMDLYNEFTYQFNIEAEPDELSIKTPDAEALREYLESVGAQTWLDGIQAQFEMHFDGNNTVGKLSPEGFEQMEMLLAGIAYLPHSAYIVVDTGDWFFASEEEGAIEADTTDEELEELARKAESKLECDGIKVILNMDTLHYFGMLREWAQDMG